MNLAAGKLNRRATIQQKTVTYDELHQPTGEAWVDLATVWADVRHVSGIEAVRSGADTSVVQASIRIRYRPGLDADMRVLCDGKTYDVRAVLDDVAARKYTDLVCALGASNG